MEHSVENPALPAHRPGQPVMLLHNASKIKSKGYDARRIRYRTECEPPCYSYSAGIDIVSRFCPRSLLVPERETMSRHCTEND